ncbi:hypothetical protein ACFUCT_23575 [Streptomyces parvus]|uniref:hypothetical protein n=1 Tax=Streptomyces TaxID=1883 RepID=UPI000A094ACF|nr:hypothetical protein [Streptomyces sp. S8]ARI56837.1 hypothetical protein A6E92_31750 [Streptomyces sp. S8]
MPLTALILILLLVVVTLLVATGVATVLHHHPAWAIPVTGAFSAMMLMATITGLLIAATHN